MADLQNSSLIIDNHKLTAPIRPIIDCVKYRSTTTSGVNLNHLTSSGLGVSLELDRLVGHDEVFEVAESRQVAGRKRRSERRRREERDRS